MPTLRLFASARDAAGTGRDVIAGDTVADVLDAARARYGARFGAVLATCRVWVNGEPAEGTDTVDESDEVAILPPVSGGATGAPGHRGGTAGGGGRPRGGGCDARARTGTGRAVEGSEGRSSERRGDELGAMVQRVAGAGSPRR